jgi:hypothetical protein
LALLGAAALALAGCGQSSSASTPQLSNIPLARGAKVVAQNRRCDRGANPYCAVQLVVTGPRYGSSGALLVAERRRLKALGWGITFAETGDERGAESPGQKLRLIYAAAAYDLKDVDLGWVRRARPIARAMAQTMFDRVPALSLMEEPGSS